MNRKQEEREEGVKEEEKREAKGDGRKGLPAPQPRPASQPHFVTRISLFQPFLKASSRNHKFMSLTLTDKASPFLPTSWPVLGSRSVWRLSIIFPIPSLFLSPQLLC